MKANIVDRAEKIRHYSHPPYSNRQPLAIPGEGNIITHNDIAFFNPWSPSPHYSSSSGAASPGYEYNSIPFLAPGQNSYRTRTSSNASFVEPPSWHSYPSNSRSPTSASSTMHNPWTSDQEQSPSLLGLSMTTSTSYPNPTPLSAPAMDLASFGIYTNPLKTVDERDDEERILLFPEQSFGMGSDIQRVDEYLDNYWRLFHPSFPLIHRPTFRAETVSPLLKAAMSAVGAQYCQDANARTESRTLHEKCLKILAQVRYRPTVWRALLMASRENWTCPIFSDFVTSRRYSSSRLSLNSAVDVPLCNCQGVSVRCMMQ